MIISVDETIYCLLDAYIACDDMEKCVAFNRLEDFGIDKYTALEIAINFLPNYIEANYVRKYDE